MTNWSEQQVSRMERAVGRSPIFGRLASPDRARLFDVMVKKRLEPGTHTIPIVIIHSATRFGESSWLLVLVELVHLVIH